MGSQKATLIDCLFCLDSSPLLLHSTGNNSKVAFQIPIHHIIMAETFFLFFCSYVYLWICLLQNVTQLSYDAKSLSQWVRNAKLVFWHVIQILAWILIIIITNIVRCCV